MNSTLSRRERKKRETRRRLMETALRLFREHGYDATTVEEITEAADVAKGTFFNYFETKEAILPALAGLRLQQLEESLLPEHGAPASPVARVKLALRLVAEDPLSDPALTRRLFAAGMRHQGMRPVHALMKLLSEQVRQAQAAGEISADLDPIHVGGMLRALFFQQVIVYHHGYRPASLPETLDTMVNLLLDGIAGPNWRQSS
ncbi:MAG: helix-turn-helix transcriptional regulator [Anaerolineae bacterium]|nr:helix-turn-helix transcriptional regulator [Anaerolineae bacterium]